MKAGGYTLHSSQFFPFSHLFPFKHSSLFHFSPFSHHFPFKQQESHLSLFLKPTASHFQFPPQPPLSRSPPSQISQISRNFSHSFFPFVYYISIVMGKWFQPLCFLINIWSKLLDKHFNIYGCRLHLVEFSKMSPGGVKAIIVQFAPKVLASPQFGGFLATDASLLWQSSTPLSPAPPAPPACAPPAPACATNCQPWPLWERGWQFGRVRGNGETLIKGRFHLVKAIKSKPLAN